MHSTCDLAKWLLWFRELVIQHRYHSSTIRSFGVARDRIYA